jgi:hypothetical protein
MPQDKGYVEQAGFKATITSASGNATSTNLQPAAVFVFAGLVEGATYQVVCQSLDRNGLVIQTLPSITLNVPPFTTGLTYTRMESATVAWS